MPARVRHGEIGELGLDIGERRARDVPLEVELAPATGATELPAAVDDAVPHAGERSRAANTAGIAEWCSVGLQV
jgi:hypothetical protein